MSEQSSQFELYQLHEPDRLITPCLLVYPKFIRANLESAIRIAGGAEKLRPHVKTHKTPQIVKMQLDLGITKFKCATLREAEMLGECGAPDVLIAYPQVGPAVARLCEIAERFPATRFATTVDNLESAQVLAEGTQAAGLVLDAYVDIDNGMHRTGVPAGETAEKLYQFLYTVDSLNAVGFHVYDGQNHQPSRGERDSAVIALMEPILRMVGNLNAAGFPVSKMVCGGTPTFPVFASFQIPDGETDIEYSPGTCVLSDFNYGRDYPDIEGIQYAAILMSRVISKQPGSGHLTLDLGNKAVAADPPAGARVHLLNVPHAVEKKQNEEHLVVASPQADSFNVGDVVYAVPAHICPTVALHRFVHVVEDGRLVDRWEVTARDRLY